MGRWCRAIGCCLLGLLCSVAQGESLADTARRLHQQHYADPTNGRVMPAQETPKKVGKNHTSPQSGETSKPQQSGQLMADKPLANLSDPTRPPAFKAPMPEIEVIENRLTFIYISKESRYAVINGIFVTIGDTINGSKVTSIDGLGVTLENGQQKEHIPFLEGVHKTIPLVDEQDEGG